MCESREKERRLEDMSEGLKLPPYGRRTLNRGSNANRLSQEDSSKVEFHEVQSLTPRKESKRDKSDLCLPPVASSPRLDKSQKPKMESILTYSRHSKDILARLKVKDGSEVTEEPQVNWPLRKGGRIKLDELDYRKVSSPRPEPSSQDT